MTESDWLNASENQQIRALLEKSGSASERKVQLLAVAVCRRIWHLLTDSRSRRAVEVLERYADQAASREELAEAAGDAYRVTQEKEHAHDRAAAAVLNAVSVYLPEECLDPEAEDDGVRSGTISDAIDACFAVAWAKGEELHPGDSGDLWFAATKAEELQHLHLLRDIFANPFHNPPRIEPTWLTWHNGLIPSLAEAAYQERLLPSGELDPTRLAVLADALEDAGCDNAAILTHLRSPGPHVRGCHVIDCLAGRK